MAKLMLIVRVPEEMLDAPSETLKPSLEKLLVEDVLNVVRCAILTLGQRAKANNRKPSEQLRAEQSTFHADQPTVIHDAGNVRGGLAPGSES